MRKAVRIPLCCLALLLTAGLALLFPGRSARENKPSAPPLLRIWVQEGESALSAWLRKRAAAYEKETRARVYIRSAAAEEAQAAVSGQAGFAPPDLLLLSNQGEAVALRGYALILKDEAAPAVTPSPTFSLFSRPTRAPAPIPTPAPLSQADLSRPVLTPPECAGAMPNSILSASPLSDFIQGKADAALLTARQAAQLPFGYRAYALPDGRGMAAFGAQALTENGQAFLRFLYSPASQQALREQGLYSPRYPLCQGQDTLEALIESGWVFPN